MSNERNGFLDLMALVGMAAIVIIVLSALAR